MKNVPRSFKTPLYPVFQIIGIALQVYMMFNISTDHTQRIRIYLLCLILFAGLFIYAFFWVKYKLKMPILRAVGVHKVMTMESPAYHELKKEIEKNQGAD